MSDIGVLVSPIGGSPYVLNGYYMLFVSVVDAQLFVDVLVAPPQRHAPAVHTEPLGQAQIVLPPKRGPRYQLSVEDPSLLWRGYAGKLASHRGYSLHVTGRGCIISHLEYGPYKMDGYYVIFMDEQSARDHIDSWFAQGHTISQV